MNPVTRTFVCDPAEPYLDHHRPGGLPLLGTVANLALIARGADRWVGARRVAAITDVAVFAPMIFADKRAREVRVALSSPDGGERVDGELASDDADGHSVLHARCTLAYSYIGEEQTAGTAISLGARTVYASNIYDCYFHGPAFRVLDRAARIDDAIVSRSATHLPAWSRDLAPGAIGARAIEFGLQTAGLLHLALDGTMLIPNSIDRIDRCSDADVGGSDALHARATRVGKGIDIEIVDAAGAPVVRIVGYRCEPLPFAQDAAKPRRLAEQLNATRHQG